MNFSEREKYKNTRTEIQVEGIDIRLRTGLWNAISTIYFDEVQPKNSAYLPNFYNLYYFFVEYYKDFLVKPVEELKLFWPQTIVEFKYKFDSLKWNEVYDLVEFFIESYPDKLLNTKFTSECNRVLARELSGFRIINSKVTRIVDEIEIESITTAFENPLLPVKEHINQAFLLFSNRTNPDYRNSIKESISAIEALSKLITKSEKATLTEALTALSKKFKIHPAFKAAIEKMYGYTSDANGIRHALLDEPEIKSEDARYFLVICSAFVNYISEKI